MKKYILLFLSMAFIVACSSDDDNVEPAVEDPIVGTWILIDASAPFDSQFCFDEESTITLNEDNSGEATFYLAAAECGATSSSGNWSTNGNTTYTISIPVLGNLTGTVNFSGKDKFTFTADQGGVLTFERE